MPLLRLNNITVKVQQHVLLHNVNLTINENEQWLIVGQSGSGKTTLLNTIAGKHPVGTGTVDILADLNKDSYANPVCLVATKHQFKDITNSNNLYYQQRFNSQDANQTLTVTQSLQNKATDTNEFWTVSKVAELLDLDFLLEKGLIQLSNGETKRLRLAVALLSQPRILLLDDPIAGLDHQTQLRFSSIFNEIVRSGISVVMTGSGTSIPDTITHVAIMQQGTIINRMPVNKYNHQSDTVSTVRNYQQIQLLVEPHSAPAYQCVVKMDKVTITYGEHTLLKQINWLVKPGERWALFGHNGAGKSTLLSLINGDNPQAYANDIVLFDKKRGTGESIWDIKRKIGFVSPELYQYFPTDQSALQVVESGYYDTQGLFRPSQATKAANAMEWLKALQIEHYAHQLLKNLPASAQRLSLLARALIKMPDLLILDEPCQGLDQQQRQQFNELIDVVVQTAGLTLIYVTHYANELPASISHTLTLQNGEVTDANAN
jgi:molybdate transport system ATP-binding protein